MSELRLSENGLRCCDDIAAFIHEKCIYNPDTPMFGIGPGDRYKSQFYMANLTTNGCMMRSVMTVLDELMLCNELDPGDYQFAGRTWSALPILGVISLHYHFRNVNTFIVRRERKIFGKNNIFEGIPNDKPVILVDDVCNSTIAFKHCHDIIAAHNIPVHPKIFCILNKKNATDNMFKWDKFSFQEAMYCVSRDQVT